MKRYMVIAVFEHGIPCTAFFNSIQDVYVYMDSLSKCIGVYFECYERRSHGSGKDYEWRYERVRWEVKNDQPE